MKEIVERLKEQRDVERARMILESAGYEVSGSINESALEEFWKLYDRDEVTGRELERIASTLGIETDGEPTEEEAKRILAAYKGEGHNTLNKEEMIERIISACSEIPGISEVQSFEEAGLMTRNKGFVVKTSNGEELQFSLLGSF